MFRQWCAVLSFDRLRTNGSFYGVVARGTAAAAAITRRLSPCESGSYSAPFALSLSKGERRAEPNIQAAVRRPVLRQAQDERKFYGVVARGIAAAAAITRRLSPCESGSYLIPFALSLSKGERRAEPNIQTAVRRPVLRQAQDERKVYGVVARGTAAAAEITRRLSQCESGSYLVPFALSLSKG